MIIDEQSSCVDGARTPSSLADDYKSAYAVATVDIRKGLYMATDIDKTNESDDWDDLEFNGIPADTDDGDEPEAKAEGAEPEDDVVAETIVPDEADDDATKEPAKEPEPTKHKNTAAEDAIVALKRAAKAKEQALREAQDKLRKYENIERAESLSKKYTDDGYDSETAKRLATVEIEKEQAQAMLEDMKFLTSNQAVLAKYPEASNELNRVREVMKATGKGISEVCGFLFSTDNSFEAKARADALAVAKNKTVPAAILSQATPSGTTLTKSQMEYKAQFEKLLGKKLSDSEVKTMLSRRRGQYYNVEDEK